MRGGSKAVWNFSENSSVLEGVGFPKAVEKDRLARDILELFPEPFLSAAGFKDGQWAMGIDTHWECCIM